MEERAAELKWKRHAARGQPSEENAERGKRRGNFTNKGSLKESQDTASDKTGAVT